MKGSLPFWFGFTISQLGQMALKLFRQHLSANHAARQSDALTLFTNELMLNYQSPLVGHIWQRCSDALAPGS
jgi:hypothetical protein